MLLLSTHLMGKSPMLLLSPTLPRNNMFLCFHVENLIHFQPIFSLTHLRSVLPSAPVKVKNIQTILKNSASVNAYKAAVNEIFLTLEKHTYMHLTR